MRHRHEPSMLVTGSDCGNPYQFSMHISTDGVVTRGDRRRIDVATLTGMPRPREALALLDAMSRAVLSRAA